MTVTLDEDVYERLQQESRSRGVSFRQTLNDVIRVGLHAKPPKRSMKIETFDKARRGGPSLTATSSAATPASVTTFSVSTPGPAALSRSVSAYGWRFWPRLLTSLTIEII